jgi:hypothetical protein
LASPLLFLALLTAVAHGILLYPVYPLRNGLG